MVFVFFQIQKLTPASMNFLDSFSAGIFFFVILLVGAAVLWFEFRKDVQRKKHFIRQLLYSKTDFQALYAKGTLYVTLQFTRPPEGTNEPVKAHIHWNENHIPSPWIEWVLRKAAKELTTADFVVTVQDEPVV